MLTAATKARKGKRYQPNVLLFDTSLEQNLLQLQVELLIKTYQPGPYTTFTIVQPKKRMISAAPYRDRVVHHSLCNIIQPLFEASFITDSYANRVDYGTHRALRRFTKFARHYQYILQGDIQKYFPNIDHQILKIKLRRKLKCPDTLWLCDLIIDNSNPQDAPPLYFPQDNILTPIIRRKGLPIGNLTSQFFANIYLDSLDHFIKDRLQIPGYVRYVDDFALFSNDRKQLQTTRTLIEEHLEALRLRLHPIKTQISATKHGANFVGFRVLPHQIRIRNASLRRARQRMYDLQQQLANNEITPAKIAQSVCSWFAHLRHGDTWHLRKKILQQFALML